MYVVSRLAPFKSGEVVSGELWPRISRTKWLISYTPNAGQGLFNTIVATQNHQVAILFVGRHSTVKIVKRFAMIHPLTLFRQKHIECTILVGIRCLVLRVFVFHPILIYNIYIYIIIYRIICIYNILIYIYVCIYILIYLNHTFGFNSRISSVFGQVVLFLYVYSIFLSTATVSDSEWALPVNHHQPWVPMPSLQTP